MTRFAVPGKCGALGASGLTDAGVTPLARSSLTRAGNMLLPSSSERIIVLRSISIGLIQGQEFVAAQQHPHQRRPDIAIALPLRFGRSVKRLPRRRQKRAVL